MALPSWLLVSVGGRRSQRLGPSPTLGSLGPSHHRRHKSRVSLRGSPCALGVSGIPYGEVRDNHHLPILCCVSLCWIYLAVQRGRFPFPDLPSCHLRTLAFPLSVAANSGLIPGGWTPFPKWTSTILVQTLKPLLGHPALVQWTILPFII
jgi:hypothetical protein